MLVTDWTSSHLEEPSDPSQEKPQQHHFHIHNPHQTWIHIRPEAVSFSSLLILKQFSLSASGLSLRSQRGGEWWMRGVEKHFYDVTWVYIWLLKLIKAVWQFYSRLQTHSFLLLIINQRLLITAHLTIVFGLIFYIQHIQTMKENVLQFVMKQEMIVTVKHVSLNKDVRKIQENSWR